MFRDVSAENCAIIIDNVVVSRACYLQSEVIMIIEYLLLLVSGCLSDSLLEDLSL